MLKKVTAFFVATLLLGQAVYANSGLTVPGVPELVAHETNPIDISTNESWAIAFGQYVAALEGLHMQQAGVPSQSAVASSSMPLLNPWNNPWNMPNTVPPGWNNWSGWWNDAWPYMMMGDMAGWTVEEYYAWLSQMGMSPWFGNNTWLPQWGTVPPWGTMPQQNWNQWWGNQADWGNWNQWGPWWDQGNWNQWGTAGWGGGPGFFGGPISFGNSVIEEEVRRLANVPFGPIFPQQVTHIRELTVILPNTNNATANGLSGLEFLTNLRYLYIRPSNITNNNSNISNLAPLSNLTNLREIRLDGHNISNLNPITNLNNVEILSVRSNNLSNINELRGTGNLRNLRRIYLGDNQIADLSPVNDRSGVTVVQ